MDIFKVLSRGTKPKKPSNATTGSSTSKAPLLPSAGARVNPQFFHDDVSGLTAARGKKRKRRKNAAAGADDDETAPADDDGDDASDIDFFAPPKPATTAATAPAQDEAEDKEQQAKKIKARLLDEDECRLIFKSHRLKFTVVAGGTAAAEEEEEEEPVRKKSKKKGDGKKDVEEGKKKKDDKMKQLFPQPLNKFGELRHIYGIAPALADNIARQGFRVPTEVQMGALPLLLRPSLALKKVKGEVVKVDEEQGIDFLGVAPTGSGKTISFLIPAIDRILRRRDENTEEHVLEAVVVAPTRELASQIVNEGRKLALGTGVRVVLMKRGITLVAEDPEHVEETEEADGQDKNEDEETEEEEDQESDQDSDADDKAKPRAPRGPAHVDILVTTPKTLLNFLSGEKVPSKNPKARKALPTVRSLILDEADVLLDPLFRKQTTALWNACTNPSLTLTCWSATMASSIETLITKHLSKRATRLSLPAPPPVLRLVVGLKDTAVPNVTHKLIYAATEQGKLLGLRNLLHPSGGDPSSSPLRPPFLVFTQTIERAQALFSELQYDIPASAGGGAARLAVLHSSLPDAARARIMARFRAGDVWVLITTDVLARGIDFAGVNGVVNYDVPGSAAAYVHRAGRTGRAGREGGVAVTFYTKEDIPFVRSVANVIAASERQAGGAGGEEGTVQKWLMDALPRVAKGDKRKLSVRGVEARRAGGKATIGTKGGIAYQH
ncbi:P-loop containing nucleoside triphosphate hydrolase protein [Schizothecium vesticola]|uniref:ATP-dependent RNA helicase ROK1 n=1 Tax=Schizothecium vesticola TaxID=314040 RepID=A0AA40K4R2_9PEZI|nr:P-loop containing nucleoside triphosphate hydrolase protein [Schizothecium vesticola]